MEQTIAGIHASGRQAVLEFTGAGSLALAWLHSVAGSSRTILEATDRYSPGSLSELLGGIPGTFVDPATVAAMAERAYLRAWRLGDDARPTLGVAMTATIATDREKRGEHRCCIAVQDQQSLRTMDLVLVKGKRDREAEERVVGELLIDAIAGACGAAEAGGAALLPEERVYRQTIVRPDPMNAGQWTHIDATGRRTVQTPVSGIVYCGSFDPLHFGHEAMAAAAARVMGLPVTFEITAVNAEKSPVGRGELERRLAQFWRRYPVVVTREPLFSAKARLFPGCVFLVGYDTAVRMIDPRFYGGSEAARDAALAEIAACGCRVLVAGRMAAGRFAMLADLAMPAAGEKLFVELPETEFRADVSATDLRAMRNRSC